MPLLWEVAVLRGLVVLLGFFATATAAAGPPRSWPLQHFVEWQRGWGSRTIDAAGLRARIDVRHCGRDQPVSEACAPGSSYLVASVAAPGLRPVILTGEPGLAAYVGIGRLTPGARHPALILMTDSGSSGGCVAIDLAVPTGSAYRAVELEDPRNGGRSLCAVMDPPRLAWPRDLTGKAYPAFLLNDDAFHCSFTSCAGSWYPPRVLALDGARTIDVSKDAALAPLYRAHMARARRACEQDRVEAQGACAAYAADAARLGRWAEAGRVIDAQVRRGCRVRVSGACPDVNRIPATFPAELTARLTNLGYR